MSIDPVHHLLRALKTFTMLRQEAEEINLQVSQWSCSSNTQQVTLLNSIKGNKCSLVSWSVAFGSMLISC